jgi:hypothetical protein
MWYALDVMRDDQSGAVISGNSGGAIGEYALPYRIIFPGFAINTIFYAAIVWGLFAVPGAVRRRVRRKRGQCAACGYLLRDITSEKCPECGGIRAVIHQGT